MAFAREADSLVPPVVLRSQREDLAKEVVLVMGSHDPVDRHTPEVWLAA